MRRRYSVVLAAAVSPSLLLGSCQNHGSGIPVQTSVPSVESTGVAGPPSTFNAGTLIAAFSDAGLRARLRPCKGVSLFGKGADCQTLSIGQVRAELFTFTDASVAEKAAAEVSGDGTTIPQVSRNGGIAGLAAVDWKGRPHFFARSRMLALFVESRGRSAGQARAARDGRVIEILRSVMGPQFAGCWPPPAGPNTQPPTGPPLRRLSPGRPLIE
jgi:hypothetical protein